MSAWHELDRLLTDNKAADPDCADSFSGPASERSIEEVERLLGVSIRGSYREFLTRYGSGQFGGFLCNGIACDDPRATTDGTLLGATQDARRRGLAIQYLVVSGPLEDGELFCLDTRSDAAEPPIVFMSGRDPEDPDFYRHPRLLPGSLVELLIRNVRANLALVEREESSSL